MILRTVSCAALLATAAGCTSHVVFIPNTGTSEAQAGASETRFRICHLPDDGDEMHRQLRAVVCGDPAKNTPNAQSAEYEHAAELIGTLAMPPGSVIAYAGKDAIPAGWLGCDGQAVSIEKYPRLFKAVGNRYGDGGGQQGFFSLPNYRGRFLRGVSGASGVDPDAASRTAPWAGGETGNVVGSEQRDALVAHKHSYQFGHAGGPDGDVPHRRIPESPTNIQSSDPEGVGVRTSSETRPTNTYVRWLIRY